MTFGKVQLALMLHDPWFAQNNGAVLFAIHHLEVCLAWQSLNVKSDKSTAMGGNSLPLKVVETLIGLYFSFILQSFEYGKRQNVGINSEIQ